LWGGTSHFEVFITIFQISFFPSPHLNDHRLARPFVLVSSCLPSCIAAALSTAALSFSNYVARATKKHRAHVSALFYENQPIATAFVDSGLVIMNPYLPAADARTAPNGATFIAMPSYPLEVKRL
jgi:hypothetical protein